MSEALVRCTSAAISPRHQTPRASSTDPAMTLAQPSPTVWKPSIKNRQTMATLPTGTVTFLFTDIEGSTRLLKRLGAEYGEVLAEHRRVLRAAAQDHGGKEVDNQGDSFLFAFRRADEAAG